MIRQRPKQHAVYNTENGRVRTNSNCECEHGDSSETGTLPEHPRTVANVLSQVLNPTHTALLATSVLDGFDPTELSQRRVACLFWIHPRFNVLLRLHLD